MKKEKPSRKPEGGQADIQPEEEPLWKTHRDGDEYARCAADPFYYVERYVHIECPEAQTLLQPFRLWPAQRPALEAMATRRRVMVLKARQLGMTWLALAEASRLLLCRPGRTVVCISRAENEARELVRRLGVRVIFCNGAASGRVYARYAQPLTGLPAVVLPSTSPANAAFSMARLQAVWGAAFADAQILQ